MADTPSTIAGRGRRRRLSVGLLVSDMDNELGESSMSAPQLAQQLVHVGQDRCWNDLQDSVLAG
jgi:hypothetical protein